MSNDVHFDKLQEMVKKSNELKKWLGESDDKETKYYLGKAIDQLYDNMRELLKEKNQN